MAKKILKYTDAVDTVKIGSMSWDDSDSYDIWTYGGADDLRLYIDGTLWLDAGQGDDNVYVGGSGKATVYGGAGDDHIEHYGNSYDDGVVRFFGGEGNDWLVSSADGEADVLDGGSGDDFIKLAAGNKGVGGSGDDVFHLYNIFDPYDSQTDVTIVEAAGGGFDTVEGNFATFNWITNIEAYKALYTKDVTINGNDAANWAMLSGGNDYVKLNGGNDFAQGHAGDDRIYGDAGDDELQGNGDDDSLYGGTGNDVLMGGHDKWGYIGLPDGVDTIYGEDGDDKLYGGHGADYLSGGAGNDHLFGDHGGYGGNTLVGGTGNDTYMTGGTQDIIVELAGQGIDTIEFIGEEITLVANVENLVHGKHPGGSSLGFNSATTILGNALANQMVGNDQINTMHGEAGADKLVGQGGNDYLRGGDNDDFLSGDDGNDQLFGDAGLDKLFGGLGNDAIYGGDGNDEISGSAGDDYLVGEGGNDKLTAGTGNDFLSGGTGYDNLYGEDGNDVIRAGEMNDYLYGDAGNDNLHGDGGSDLMWGGAGADKFSYTNLADSKIGSGIDQIKDFVRNEDKIDLSAIDARATMSGNQAFTWKGLDARIVVPGEGSLWGVSVDATATNAAYIKVYGDVNGDGTAEFQIDVYGSTALSADDFIL